jgi:hypothetical protein
MRTSTSNLKTLNLNNKHQTSHTALQRYTRQPNLRPWCLPPKEKHRPENCYKNQKTLTHDDIKSTRSDEIDFMRASLPNRFRPPRAPS